MKGLLKKITLSFILCLGFLLIPSNAFAMTPDWWETASGYESETYNASILEGGYIIYRASYYTGNIEALMTCAGGFYYDVYYSGGTDYQRFKCIGDTTPFVYYRSIGGTTWTASGTFTANYWTMKWVTGGGGATGTQDYYQMNNVFMIEDWTEDKTCLISSSTKSQYYYPVVQTPSYGEPLYVLEEAPTPFDFAPSWAGEYQIFFKNTKGDYSLMHSDSPMCFETVSYTTYPFFDYNSENKGLLTNSGMGWIQTVSLKDKEDELFYQPMPEYTINDIEDFSQYVLIASSYEVPLCSGGSFFNRSDSDSVPDNLITDMADFNEVYDTNEIWDCSFDFGTFSWLEPFAVGTCRMINKGYNVVINLPSAIYNLFVPPSSYFVDWIDELKTALNDKFDFDFTNLEALTSWSGSPSDISITLDGEDYPLFEYTDMYNSLTTLRVFLSIVWGFELFMFNYDNIYFALRGRYWTPSGQGIMQV